MNLKTKDRTTLLEHDVPDIETSVHLGCVKDGRTNWIPTSVGEV